MRFFERLRVMHGYRDRLQRVLWVNVLGGGAASVLILQAIHQAWVEAATAGVWVIVAAYFAVKWEDDLQDYVDHHLKEVLLSDPTDTVDGSTE